MSRRIIVGPPWLTTDPVAVSVTPAGLALAPLIVVILSEEDARVDVDDFIDVVDGFLLKRNAPIDFVFFGAFPDGRLVTFVGIVHLLMRVNALIGDCPGSVNSGPPFFKVS